MEFDWSDGALAEGLRLYDSGEFFAAHEHWEMVWLRSPEPEKTFLQGLIQVTAAFHHLQRGNRLGTALLLQAALRRIDAYPPAFGGISVTLLCNDVRECLQKLEAGEPPSQLASPRMKPLRDQGNGSKL
jgi:predicted metal-dependent hydrolase